MQGQPLPPASMPWTLAPDAPHLRSHAQDGGPLAAPDDELGAFQFDPASSRALAAQDQRRAQNNGSPLILHVPPPVGTAAPQHHTVHHRYAPNYTTGAQLPPPTVHTETPQKTRGTVLSHHHGAGSSYMISAAGSDASPVSTAMESSMYSSSFHHPQQQQQGVGGLTTTDPFMDSTMSISQVLPFDPTAVGAPPTVVAVSNASPPSVASMPLAPAANTTHTIHYIELPPGAVPPGGMLPTLAGGPPTHHGLPPGTVTTTVYHHGPAPAFYPPQLPSGMMPPLGPGNTVVIHSSAPSPPQALGGVPTPPPNSMGQPRGLRTPASGAASRMQGASPSAGMPAYRTQTATPTSVPRATPNHEIESPPTQLIVNYLSPRVTEPELRQIFEQFGPIEVCRVIYDKPSGAAKGYGFVYYFHAVDASRAVASMNGFEMYGKWLKVSFAVPQRRKDPTTGLYESGPQASSHS